jgi:DNA-binding CsgD family transcriptional regulator
MPGKGRPPQTWCSAGLHRLDDPTNVYLSRTDTRTSGIKRQCRPCALDRRKQRERAGKPFRPYLSYRVTPQQLAILQCIADGLTVEETAERMYLAVPTIREHLKSTRRKYGVTNDSAAVAQALKRNLIQPDRATAKRLPHRILSVHIHALRALIRSERRSYRPYDKRLPALLDACMSWTEPHAVSVLWAAGRLTNRDVPQTRNQYQRKKGRKPREDTATWLANTDGALSTMAISRP